MVGKHVLARDAVTVIARTHAIELREITLPAEEYQFCFQPVVISWMRALTGADVVARLPCSP